MICINIQSIKYGLDFIFYNVYTWGYDSLYRLLYKTQTKE